MWPLYDNCHRISWIVEELNNNTEPIGWYMWKMQINNRKNKKPSTSLHNHLKLVSSEQNNFPSHKAHKQFYWWAHTPLHTTICWPTGGYAFNAWGKLYAATNIRLLLSVLCKKKKNIDPSTDILLRVKHGQERDMIPVWWNPGKTSLLCPFECDEIGFAEEQKNSERGMDKV